VSGGGPRAFSCGDSPVRSPAGLAPPLGVAPPRPVL